MAEASQFLLTSSQTSTVLTTWVSAAYETHELNMLCANAFAFNKTPIPLFRDAMETWKVEGPQEWHLSFTTIAANKVPKSCFNKPWTAWAIVWGTPNIITHKQVSAVVWQWIIMFILPGIQSRWFSTVLYKRRWSVIASNLSKWIVQRLLSRKNSS